MTTKDLLQHAKNFIQDHPELEDEVNGIVDLAFTEIEDECASERTECENAIEAINQLIEND